MTEVSRVSSKRVVSIRWRANLPEAIPEIKKRNIRGCGGWGLGDGGVGRRWGWGAFGALGIEQIAH